MDSRSAPSTRKLSTGISDLDAALGGGLLPGTLTMVIGATGVGKTQLALHFAQAGKNGEGCPGSIIDLSSRGDSQNHSGYTRRMFSDPLTLVGPDHTDEGPIFHSSRPPDILPFLGYGGRRVLRSQMDTDQWHAWQAELNRRLPRLYRFVYQHLVYGTRRFIIDGIEPQTSASDSLQLDLLELIYHRMLRHEHDWLAREVLRERFLENQTHVEAHAYDHRASAALVLITTKQSMLEQLMTEPFSDGDLAAGANTVILMGRTLEQGVMKRALYIAKHRGSYAAPQVLPFDIGDSGLLFR